MNNNINSGKKIEKQKKSTQIKKKDPDKWTFGRAFLFLLITFDLLAVLAWLIYYRSDYKEISPIVGGVWTAVITFLSYMKIKRGRRMSLAEFIKILPVKMVIITYTVIIFLLVVIFVFAEFPVHTVHITACVDEKHQSGVSISWDGNPYDKTGEYGTLIIPSVKAGKHALRGDFPGCPPETPIVHVPLLKLKHHKEIKLKTTPPTKGNIHISSYSRGKVFNEAEVYIDNKKQNRQTPTTLRNLLPREYSIKVIKTDEDYCYEAVKEITVKAGKTAEAKMELKPVTGNIHISSYFRSKAFNGAEIYIDGKKQDEQTPTTFRNLPPGKYPIKLIKIYKDYNYEAEQEIAIRAGETAKVEIELILIIE